MSEALEALRADLKHPSKAGMQPLIDRFVRDPAFRDTVVGLSISQDHPYSWRAAWVMKWAIRADRSCWNKHLDQIIRALPEITTHQQLGAFLRELASLELTEEQRELLLSKAIDELETQRETEYTKAYAVEVLDRSVRDYPELAREFTLIVERALETLEKAYARNKAIKALKRWAKYAQ
jgi:hypothetical protein